jgi:hypothetical protein
VISSIKVKVIRLSVKPIIAKIKLYGKTIFKTSIKFSVIYGIAKLGNHHLRELNQLSAKYVATVQVLDNSGIKITIKVTITIQARPEGIAFVSFGKK